MIRHSRYVLSRHVAENKRRRREIFSGIARDMPSLMRLLFFVGLFCGVIFVAAAALVAFVEPAPREMSQPVKPELLNK